MSRYTAHGYTDRLDYLGSLADSHGVPIEFVLMMAEELPESEDFDGLVSEIDDYAAIYGEE